MAIKTYRKKTRLKPKIEGGEWPERTEKEMEGR